MIYTLKDDRVIEYNYVYDNLPPGAGSLLDLGTPANFPTSQFALKQGYRVTAVDLRGHNRRSESLEFRAGDFLEMKFAELFDWILNISSVEHFGLAGRYGIMVGDTNADLKTMVKLRTLMKPTTTMLLTIPVGQDEVIYSLHRVYGQERLPQLLESYEIVRREFWGKFGGIDKYRPIDEKAALSTKAQCRDIRSQLAKDHYYALGCFMLRL